MARKFESLERLAQQDPSLRFRTDESLGVVVHLRGVLGEPAGDPADIGIAFVNEHRDLFGEVEPDTLEILERAEDPDSGTTAILQQHHGGHRVLGGSIRFHADGSGRLDTVSNRLFPDLATVAREPEIEAERAVKALRRATRVQGHHAAAA